MKGNWIIPVFLGVILALFLSYCSKFEKVFKEEFNRPEAFSNANFYGLIRNIEQANGLELFYITGKSLDWSKKPIIGYVVHENFESWNLIFRKKNEDVFKVFKWDGKEIIELEKINHFLDQYEDIHSFLTLTISPFLEEVNVDYNSAVRKVEKFRVREKNALFGLQPMLYLIKEETIRPIWVFSCEKYWGSDWLGVMADDGSVVNGAHLNLQKGIFEKVNLLGF